MTKQHMTRAAQIVKAIGAGKWTDEEPDWALLLDTENPEVYRAVQTAEAFIILFQACNDRFDVQRFLIACGLAAKGGKS